MGACRSSLLLGRRRHTNRERPGVSRARQCALTVSSPVVLPYGAPALRRVGGLHDELVALELVDARQGLADQGADQGALDVIREGVRAFIDLESAERGLVAALRVLLRSGVRDGRRRSIHDLYRQ